MQILQTKTCPTNQSATASQKENKQGSRPPRGESIEKRPEIINSRDEFGHWEMDTVYSAAETSLRALLVLTERKTRKRNYYPDA